MTRPDGLQTKIFLDSGDPAETKEIISLLGFLDGQTTNPSLVAKNPLLQKKIAEGASLTSTEVNNFYKGVIQDIAAQLPEGSVSIEVYADATTATEDILTQARDMNTWIPNAHIKFPTTNAGLAAAETFVSEDAGRVNMTLVFSEAQAAAVHAATNGAQKGEVFLSPFIGRLDDIGVDGMSLIKNIQTIYRNADSHVEILAASVRHMDHFLAALALEVDIMTVPYRLLKEWADLGMPIPDNTYEYATAGRTALVLENIDLSLPWQSQSIHHNLTDAGLQRFADDWNNLIGA